LGSTVLQYVIYSPVLTRPIIRLPKNPLTLRRI